MGLSKGWLVIIVFLLLCPIAYASECSNYGGICRDMCNVDEIEKSWSCVDTEEPMPIVGAAYKVMTEEVPATEAEEQGLSTTQAGKKCCLSKHALNSKDDSKYLPKEVFMISDKDWRKVLMMVPLTVWTDSSGIIHKYPFLVYHEESFSAFDVDSTVHFLQLYAPERLTYFDSLISIPLAEILISDRNVDQEVIQQNPNDYFGSGLEPSQINLVSFNDYFSYWESFNSVVVVDYDNYEAGLMAAVYASYFNMPLIFVDSNNLVQYQNVISGRNIYVVDTIDSAVSNYINSNANLKGTFTKEELEQEYVSLTNTDKIILVNTADKTGWIWEEFIPDKSSNVIYTTFQKTSLLAPILAAGRHEVIIDAADAGVPFSGSEHNCEGNPEIKQNAVLVDSFVAQKTESLIGENAQYLTIIACPRAIPDSVLDYCFSGPIRNPKDIYYGLEPNSAFELTIVASPSAATDSDGNVHIAWMHSMGEQRWIYYSKINGETGEKLIDNVKVCNDEKAFNPDLAIDPSNNAHIVWQDRREGNDPNIFYSKINGETGEELIDDLKITDFSSISASIDVDNEGNVHLVARGFVGAHKMFYTKIDGSSGIKLVDNIELSQNNLGNYPTIAVDQNNYVHVVWPDNRDGNYEIYYAKLSGSDGQKLVGDIRLTEEDAESRSPSVGTDSNNDVHIVWHDSRTGSYQVFYTKIDPDNGQPIIDDLMISNVNGYYSSDVDLDGDDNAHVVWFSYSMSATEKIYYSKVDGSTGTLLIDNLHIDTYAGDDGMFPDVGVDPNGDVHIAYQDYFDSNWQIYYTKLGGVNGETIISPTWISNVRIGFYMGTARIYGITTSDVSSYIAKSLFYDEMIDDIYAASYYSGVSIASSFVDYIDRTLTIKTKTSQAGYDSACYTCDEYYSDPCLSSGCRTGCICKKKPDDVIEAYTKKQFLAYGDHGFYPSWGHALSSDPASDVFMPYMDLPVGVASACLTNHFWQPAEYLTFGPNFLRRGGIAYYGAAGAAQENPVEYDAVKYLTEQSRYTIGEVNKMLYDTPGFTDYYVVLGDPVLKPKFKEVNWE